MQDLNTHAVPIIFTEDVPVLSECILFCDEQDERHDWHPTIIIGYYLCRTCDALGACTTCVSKVRGKATITGTCQAHLLRLAAAQAEQYQQEEPEEVLR